MTLLVYAPASMISSVHLLLQERTIMEIIEGKVNDQHIHSIVCANHYPVKGLAHTICSHSETDQFFFLGMQKYKYKAFHKESQKGICPHVYRTKELFLCSPFL